MKAVSLAERAPSTSSLASAGCVVAKVLYWVRMHLLAGAAAAAVEAVLASLVVTLKSMSLV